MKPAAAPAHPVRAVYDDGLKSLLESLRLYGKFVNGRLRCSFSGDVITWENLYALYPDSGAVKVCCAKPECVKQLAEKLSPTSYVVE